MNEIIVNGETYVKKTENYKHPKKAIVICDRGWIVVGNLTEDDDSYYLTNASVIRKWGTTQGIGELAEKGPLENTKLDKCPDFKTQKLTTVGVMSVNEENWK